MATIADGKGVFALAAFDTSAELKKHEFSRPEAGENDVAIAIQYCGMCHSDLHACNGDWGVDKFPLTPGHEISGIVTAVGTKVSKFGVGDKVGVGCMVESCRNCGCCKEGLEQHCPQMIQTYSSVFPDGKGPEFQQAVGYHTNGGYSTAITVNQHFVFKIPDSMDLSYAGVLLCAGITVFSPLNRHVLKNGGGAGKRVGIVGFGGLGHVAAKIAKAMGAEVTVLSRGDKKASTAKSLGADYLDHLNAEAIGSAARSMDVVLDTISCSHEIAPLVNLLKVGGTYVLLGGIPQPFSISPFQMLFSRQRIEGSLIGGVGETQEMLDFCAQHGIVPNYRVIHAKDASSQWKAMTAGSSDAERCVIDVGTIKEL